MLVNSTESREHVAAYDHRELQWKVKCKTELHIPPIIHGRPYAYHKADNKSITMSVNELKTKLKGMDAKFANGIMHMRTRPCHRHPS